MILLANSGLLLSGKPEADRLDSDRYPYGNYACNFLVLLDSALPFYYTFFFILKQRLTIKTEAKNVLILCYRESKNFKILNHTNHPNFQSIVRNIPLEEGGGGAVLPTVRLMGMCRWIFTTGLTILGLHFCKRH